MKKIQDFIKELAETDVTPNVCNQYSYEATENAIRRNNLYIYLRQMYKLRPRVIFVGEAPGYRGCRLTGVPFTSEHMLIHNIEGLNLFGKEAGYRLAVKKDKVLKEATATIIWETLIKHNLLALAWNAFPFHPHREESEASNRTPTRQELIIGEKSLRQMIEMFNIKEVVAVGRKAEYSLNKLNISAHTVRHPAQGGKKDFVEGIKMIKERLS